MPVYKDKQMGTFYYNTYITIDGVKKKRMKRGFKTRSEARKAEAELLLDDGIKTSDNPFQQAAVPCKYSHIIHLWGILINRTHIFFPPDIARSFAMSD